MSVGALLTLLALGACQTRSFSDPGLYSTNRLYRGELSDLDVIGASSLGLDEAGIRAAVAEHRAPRLTPSSRVMLVQSGALMPDPELREAFAEAFSVTGFSGIPTRDGRAGADDATQGQPASLRLAAARGGLDAIVCVWGVLETKKEDLDTKAVSWVPVFGWFVTDEQLDTRLRLRFVVVDVPTGNWQAFEPDPVSDLAASSPYGRDLGDTAGVGMDQAVRLKQVAVEAGVRAFLEEFLQK